MKLPSTLLWLIILGLANTRLAAATFTYSYFDTASKEEKGLILDRLEKTIRMHRKAIIRRFGALQKRKEGYDWLDHRGRPTYYTPDVVAALHEVWEDSHELCAERLHDEVKEYQPHRPCLWG